jgi:FAD synthetase
MEEKRSLAALFSLGVKGEEADAKAIARMFGIGEGEADEALRSLAGKGLAESRGASYRLTAEGRKKLRVVFIGGGFELIHYGHVYTIEKAKGLGDVLVVSVARDSTIRRRKKREPLVGEEDRVKMLSSLRQVDAAVLGAQGDIYVTLEKVKPDIVALGYDQYHIADEVEREAKKRGIKVQVVRLDSPYPDIKTSAILKEF